MASLADSQSQAGLRTELRITPPGIVELHPAPDHVLRINAGSPVRGHCRRLPFVTTRGDIDLCPRGMTDAWQQHDLSTTLVVQLSAALIQRAAQDLVREPDRVELQPRCHFRDPQIEHISWALDAEQQAGRPSGLLYTESLGIALAIRLLAPMTAITVARGGLTRTQLRRLTDYIEENLDRDLSLAELAGISGISVSHLKTAFRHSMGLPVHSYVVRRRVDRAKTLLVERRLPVGQVAAEVGFSHQSHLARWMRRLLGTTPSALRRPERYGMPYISGSRAAEDAGDLGRQSA